MKYIVFCLLEIQTQKTNYKLSSTPDRNLNIVGIKKDRNSKKYNSYDKDNKTISTDYKSKKSISGKKNKRKNKNSIKHICSLLNSIYNNMIDIKINSKDFPMNKKYHENIQKNQYDLKKKGIFPIFDSIFCDKKLFSINFNKVKNKSSNNGKKISIDRPFI